MNATQYDLTLVWLVLLCAGLAVAGILAIRARVANGGHAQVSRKAQQSLQALEERTHSLALYDEHTTMRNRASFQQEIVAWIQRSEQIGQSFDLFHCALRLGTEAHDGHIEIAMRDIAERIQPRLRDTDILARFNKTEFIVLRKREHAADLPQRLHEQLHVICSQPIQRIDGLILPQPRVGSAQFPNDGRHSRALLLTAQRQAAMLAIPVPLQRVA